MQVPLRTHTKGPVVVTSAVTMSRVLEEVFSKGDSREATERARIGTESGRIDAIRDFRIIDLNCIELAATL